MPEKPHILIPNISFHLSDIYRQLGIMQQTLVSLDAVVESSINDSAIYLAASDKLIEEFQPLDFSPQNMMQIIQTALIFINPGLSLLCVVAFLYLLCRIRTMAAAFALLLGPRAVKALNVTARKIYMPDAWRKSVAVAAIDTPPAATGLPFSLPTMPVWENIEFQDQTYKQYVVAVLLVILLLLILFCCAKSCFFCMPCLARCKNIRLPISLPSHHFKFKLFLAISARSRHCMIELMTVPFDPIEYEFKAARFTQAVQIAGVIAPSLRVEWPDLIIQHKILYFTVKLPKFVRLSWPQAFTARKLLRHDHCIAFYTQDCKGNFALMPLATSLWQQQTEPKSIEIHMAREQPPLYPRLGEVTQSTRL